MEHENGCGWAEIGGTPNTFVNYVVGAQNHKSEPRKESEDGPSPVRSTRRKNAAEGKGQMLAAPTQNKKADEPKRLAGRVSVAETMGQEEGADRTVVVSPIHE